MKESRWQSQSSWRLFCSVQRLFDGQLGDVPLWRFIPTSFLTSRHDHRRFYCTVDNPQRIRIVDIRADIHAVNCADN